MNCRDCGYWILQRANVYDNGDEIITYTAPEGKGHCNHLGIETPHGFGCNVFSAGEHLETTSKSGTPWSNWIMIDCPRCKGSPAAGDGYRCACGGVGKVRMYDDGYIGEEQTRKHPAESQLGQSEINRIEKHIKDTEQTKFLDILHLPKNITPQPQDPGLVLAPVKSGMDSVIEQPQS